MIYLIVQSCINENIIIIICRSTMYCITFLWCWSERNIFVHICLQPVVWNTALLTTPTPPTPIVLWKKNTKSWKLGLLRGKKKFWIRACSIGSLLFDSGGGNGLNRKEQNDITNIDNGMFLVCRTTFSSCVQTQLRITQEISLSQRD